jgi:hypothetical protein
VTAHKFLEEFALLGDEIPRPGDHLAEPGIHFVLILALCHSVKLAHLFHELVHGKHRGGQCFALFVDVFGASDDLVVQNLV